MSGSPVVARKEQKRRTRRQHLAGKPRALRAREEATRRPRGERAGGACARATRVVPRLPPDRARMRESPESERGLRRVEPRPATDLEGVRFLGGGVVPARLGEHLGASDEFHGVRGGGLDESEALEIGGGGDGGHGDVRAVEGTRGVPALRGRWRLVERVREKTRRPRNVVARNERRQKRQIGRKIHVADDACYRL